MVDDEREARIRDEVIVDAYGPEEQTIGWYNYLDMTMHFPFRAQCIAERATSPLRPEEKVTVIGMASAEECDHEMFVQIRWNRREFAVPLSQFTGVTADDETSQAICDWHYWIDAGHQL